MIVIVLLLNGSIALTQNSKKVWVTVDHLRQVRVMEMEYRECGENLSVSEQKNNKLNGKVVELGNKCDTLVANIDSYKSINIYDKSLCTLTTDSLKKDIKKQKLHKWLAIGGGAINTMLFIFAIAIIL